jgi:hypothetical protein
MDLSDANWEMTMEKLDKSLWNFQVWLYVENLNIEKMDGILDDQQFWIANSE